MNMLLGEYNLYYSKTEFSKKSSSYALQNGPYKKKFEGTKDINDDTYQLYLVEKYNIKKNDTLNKFVLNDKPYNDLIEVLKVAHAIEIVDDK